jgi:hypothetical protein
LGVGEGEPGVDLKGLATGVPAVGLDGGVVDALGQVKRKWRRRSGGEIGSEDQDYAARYPSLDPEVADEGPPAARKPGDDVSWLQISI